MQIYFHSRLCSYLPRVPILVEGTVCTWVFYYYIFSYFVLFLYISLIILVVLVLYISINIY